MAADSLRTSTLSNEPAANLSRDGRAYHTAFQQVTREYLNSCMPSHPELGTNGWIRKCAASFENFDSRFPSLEQKREVVTELEAELTPTRELVTDAFREVSEMLGNWRLDVELPEDFDPDPFDEDC